MNWASRARAAALRQLQRPPVLAIVKAGRQAGQSAHKVAAQGITKARMAGAKLAKHIVAVQKAADLDPRLIRESLRSAGFRPMSRNGDRSWQLGYVAQAERLLNPPALPSPAPLPPQPPARPSWPHPDPHGPQGPDRDAG